MASDEQNIQNFYVSALFFVKLCNDKTIRNSPAPLFLPFLQTSILYSEITTAPQTAATPHISRFVNRVVKNFSEFF